MIPKHSPVRSRKLRESARGETCTMRLAGICTHDPETVVLCHLRDLAPSGMGTKPSDLHAVYACHACHDVIDGRRKTDLTPIEIGREEGRAMCETIMRFSEKGLLTVKGAK